MSRQFWRSLLWLPLGVGLLVTAWLLINTTFMLYDDEGYVLLTYRNFLAGGRLYDDIFSQYGPWPYVYHLVVTSGLNETLTHTLGRTLTAVHWTLCALLVGGIASRITGRTSAAILATSVSFGLLWQMSSEPSHPGSLICVTLAVVILAVITAHGSGRWAWVGVAIGAGCALLVLTKINVGVLLIAGAGAAALRLTAWPASWQKPATLLATLGLLAVPWGLMGRKLGETWVLLFAIQFTLSAAGLIWVTPIAKERRRIPPHTWLIALASFVFTLVLIATTLCARGTSLSAMVQTVLIDPLRHPTSFMIGFTWKPAVWPVAAACWLLAARAGWELRRQGGLHRFTRNAVIGFRLVIFAAFVANAETWLTTGGVGLFIIFCLPLLPVFLISLRPETETEAGRTEVTFWVASLALPQVLHAYPVAGSQMGWGTFLLVPLVIAGLQDTWGALNSALTRWGRRMVMVGWGLLIAVGFAQIGLLFHTGWDRYRTSKPLDLPGAEDIRAGDSARLTLRILTLNATVHADVLFSRPGMFSYNLWTGIPTPTAQNATHWFWLLDETAQNAIIDRLQQTPRSAIITNEGLDEFLEKIHVPSKGPLPPFIQTRYRSLLTLGSFHFLVPQDSRAVPFGRVEVLVPAKQETPTDAPALLQTNVALDGQLASVRIQKIQAPWSAHETYSDLNARIVLEPITSRGETSGAAIQLPLAAPVHGLFRLSVFMSHRPTLTHPKTIELVGLDHEGKLLSESAF